MLFLNFFVFLSLARLFDLSSDVLQPEQEYYLQPVEPGRSRNAASICPVDFSFGGDHLWDKFSVSSAGGIMHVPNYSIASNLNSFL